MPSPRYDADPSLATVPLARDEVEEMRDRGKVRGLDNHRATHHLLTRVAATIAHLQGQVDGLHGQVAKMQLQSRSRGSLSSTLDPREVLAYLDPDVLAAHVDGHMRWQLTQVQARVAATDRREAAVNQAVANLQAALAGLAGRHDVPADVADQLAAIVSTLDGTQGN